jgi:hypothetical protein
VRFVTAVSLASTFDHRLAPAGSRSWLGLSIGAPSLNTTRFSQQEVFEYELIYASGKMFSARETRHFLTRHLWSGFDLDDFVKGGAVRTNEGFERRRSASSHCCTPISDSCLVNSTLDRQVCNIM